MQLVRSKLSHLIRFAMALSLAWTVVACDADPGQKQPVWPDDSMRTEDQSPSKVVPPHNMTAAIPQSGGKLQSLSPRIDHTTELLASFLEAGGVEKVQALQRLWMAAAESEITDEVLAALTEAVHDQNPRVGRQAVIALNDLAALKVLREFERETARTAKLEPPQPGTAETGVPQPALPHLEGTRAISGTAEVDPNAAFEQVPAEMWEQSLRGRDQQERLAALQSVSQRRSAGAMAVLAEGTRDEQPRNRRFVVRALWYAAADNQDPSGQARAALEAALVDPDAETAALARQALNDLDRLEAESSKPGSDGTLGHVDPPDPFLTVAPAEGRISESSLLTQSQKERALYAPEPADRGAALRTIALSRSDDATETLIASANDTEPRNRRSAIRGLWFAAADGKDAQGRAQLVLEQALRDSDPQVAALARRALDDLARLRVSR